MSFDLNFHMHRLLRTEPFFAAFSRQIEKYPDNSIRTAAVGFDRVAYKFILYYNEDFMEKLSDEHKLGVLKHEFYHLILSHLNKRLPFEQENEKQLHVLWNIATDLAINHFIADELPDFACVPGQNRFANYPPGLTAEAYYTMLKKDKENNTGPFKDKPQAGSGEPQTLDDHTKWEEVAREAANDSDAARIFEEKLKELTKNAVNEVDGENYKWGSVPQSVRKELYSFIAPALSPEKVLRYFIKTSTRSEKISTIRRINTRYPYIHPGFKRKRTASIAISIDQSGSVDDYMLQKFFSFLNEFASHVTFTVIPFDSKVSEKDIYIWKKGEKRKWTRVKNGGTDFNAPTRWVNENSFDGHIIITDMQAEKPIPSKCQRIWITNHFNKNKKWFNTNEKVLALD